MSAVRRWRALTALLLVLSACAAQAPPRVTPAALPRRYEGRYFWAERVVECGYQVVLSIDAATPAADGALVLRGSIAYEPGGDRMSVDGRVDPVTLRVTLRESAPTNPDAVVDGVFEGSLSADLASLVAIWTTTGSGATGALVVRAQGR